MATQTLEVNGDMVSQGAEQVLNSASLSANNKKEFERLQATHELYTLYAKNWDFYLAAYEGGDKFANEQNIFRHPREHEDDWRERVKRAHYHNYCERLVDFFTDFIFAETIDRTAEDTDNFFGQFISDVNKKGEDITEFMRQVSDDAQIFGMIYVLVDSPTKDPSAVISKADEVKQGIRPYFVMIRPVEILDWVTDAFDKFIYIKRKQMIEDFDPATKSKKNILRFTEWYNDEIHITDVDITDKKNIVITKQPVIPNALKEIPIEVVRYKRSKDNRFMGNSFLRDLAMNNREVLNLTSLEQEFLYKQCFNVLAMERDSQLDLQDQQDGEWGISNVLYYPKDGKPPIYITPDSGPADKIAAARQTCVNEMYKRAAQDMVNELFNGGKSSGFSKSMSFSTTVPYIASRADTLERTENRLFTLAYKYMNQEWKGKIKYKDRYEITNLTDALAQMTAMFKDLQMPSETFAKAELKRIIHEFDGKLPYEQLKKAEDEIDGMDFKEFQDTMKLAFIGRAAMSPDTPLAFGDKPTTNPTPGKDTAPKASTATRAQSSSAEIKAESSKKPKGK